MSKCTLAIVFRNAHPERTPIRSELYLLPRDRTGVHRDYPNQANFFDPKSRPHHLHSRNAASNSLC